MPGVSRNLYSIDDVKAAAIYSMVKGRGLEAVFWCMELVSSDLGGDAIYCLVLAWLLTIGPLRCEWYMRAWDTFRGEEVTAEQIAAYCLSLCSAIASRPAISSEEEYSTTHDSTAAILVAERAKGYTTGGYHALKEGDWVSLRDAVRGPSGGVARGISGGVARGLAFLDRLERLDLLVGGEAADRLLPLAFAVGYLSTQPLSSEQKGVCWRPLVLKASREGADWISSVAGVRRARRVYAIPSECRLAEGSRLESLRCGLEGELLASEWWGEKIRGEYGGLVTDDDRERFYDTEFPEDIPDEWSLEDQQKSHGGSPIGSWIQWLARHCPSDRSAFLSGPAPSWYSLTQGLSKERMLELLGF